MEKEIERVVSDMANKAIEAKNALDAMQYTQAMVNATNALRCLRPV